jgi:hypothetical protein
LAEAIVNAFGFDFDHASGYYSRLAGDICGSPLIYELIAEMGDIDSEARSVKKPKSSRSSLNRGQILSKKSATFWDHALERLSSTWNCVIGKKSLNFNELELVKIEKSEQLFRDIL